MAKTVRRLSRRLSHWLFGSKELELELESDSMTLEGLVQSLSKPLNAFKGALLSIFFFLKARLHAGGARGAPF